MPQWEYTIIDLKDDGRGNMRPWQVNGQEFRDWRNLSALKVLNQYGSEGWELVAVRADAQGIESYYLKRQR